ncbi:trichohyalin-like [Watersipora subatra]|uniref:trichohyalin-like n=1 Tax=Watersipora subatra TaxID=2589382 RepID=UPI00355C8765
MSRISSTFKKTKESSGSKGTYLTDVPRARSPSPLRRSSSPSLRKSRSGKLNKSLTNSAELQTIENDYIKNLQQQVYFLELEANYLREQAKKATDMHPKMSAEAERMLYKLRNMQTDVDELNLEVKRREASLDVVQSEKERVLTRLEQEEIERQREKRTLSEEIIQLRRERDQLYVENSRKSNQVEHVSTDKDKVELQLLNAEDTIRMLRKQLDEKTHQHKVTELALGEKRAELLDAESHAREVEDRYITNAAVVHDRTVKDLRDEIRSLRGKLKEAELRNGDEQRLRDRAQQESSEVLQDNTVLSNRVDDLERQLARERELREATDGRRSRNLVELSMLSDKEKQLQAQLRQTQEMLREEKNRSESYLEQLSKQKNMATSLELNNTSTRSALYESEGKHAFLENENRQLKRDKEMLVDHVAELQRQLARKDVTLASNKKSRRDLELELSTLEHDKMADTSLQSSRWKEFEDMADSMKSLSRSMARASSPTRSPRSSIRSPRASRKFGKGMYAL